MLVQTVIGHLVDGSELPITFCGLTTPSSNYPMSSSEDLRDRIPISHNRVGSVFLGDFQRHRHLSSPSIRSIHSTPTSSPPNTAVSPVFSLHRPQNSISDIDIDIDMDSPAAPIAKKSVESTTLEAGSQSLKPGKIDPMLALELRLRWLEALILGVKQDLAKDKKCKSKESEYASISTANATASAHLKRGETLVRLAQTVEQKLDKALEGNEGLKRFMDNCALGSILPHGLIHHFV